MLRLVGRTPHGVRELKLVLTVAHLQDHYRRTPHGVRELKHRRAGTMSPRHRVAPRTGCVN